MSNESKPSHRNQEEIDLLYLFVKLGEFIKRAVLGLFNFILSILIFLLQKWYYFAIAIALTLLSAFFLNKITTPYFHSDLNLRSNATHNQAIMPILDKLGEYARARNYQALSNDLNMSIEEAGLIRSIQTYWIYDIGDDGIFDGLDTEEKYIADTSIVKIDSVFCVRAEVYETEIFSPLEVRLVSYLENNSFLASLNKQRLSDLESQLSQIEYEIEKLDSLQKREYFTNPDELRQKDGQIVFTSENTIRLYHPQMFSLLELKHECERDLNIYRNVVTVLDSFSEPVVPVNGTIQYAMKLLWYFLGFALLVAIVINFRKKIWASEE